MKKSVKIRKIIFKILNEIFNKSINFDESFQKFTKNISFNDQEKSMIYNITLNSLRNKLFIDTILSKFLKKKTSNKIKILLTTAITQLLFLDFKDYAVTYDSVEIAKKNNLNPGLINSVLKNIIYERNKIDKKHIIESNIPLWFRKKLFKVKINPKKIIEVVSNEPSLHIVFKKEKFLQDFKTLYEITSKNSAFIKTHEKISEIENFYKGQWWVQDFSSMLPIHLSPEIGKKKLLDMCAAPGGKAFQALSLNCKITLNDISKKRIVKLKQNLKRLNFKKSVLNIDSLNIPETEKFDVVILDSPCSGIGTLRRNPEILFKKKPPNLEFLTKVQKNLLNKAAKILNKNGILIYMVCSFFYDETKDIKNKFLEENKNFSQYRFKLGSHNMFKNFLDDDGDIFCIPSKHQNCMVDGFYSVKFIKND